MCVFRSRFQALFSYFSGQVVRRLGFGARTLAVSTALSIAVASFALIGATPADAGCIQTGTTVTCSGDLTGFFNFNTSAGINDLEINGVTTGPSQASLQGIGTTAGTGTNGTGSYSCSNAGDCTIDNTVQPPTCTVNSGAPAGTTCVPATVTAPGGGPSGNSGPQVTVNVAAPTTGPVTVGGASAINPPVAVFGISTGSAGGTGGSGFFSDGGTGGNGVDGGTVSVTFVGQIPNVSQGGVLAQSIGGAGGTGGDSTLASGGQGGEGGFGGQATATFNGGSIVTSGDGNNGVTAISQGGNGGSGGNGGITFIYSIGGAGNIAGQAGEAQVVTSAGTTITTNGNYANGITALSVGGGGGSGNGGFGLFFSGAGGGSTGGNGGDAIVTADSTITTFGTNAMGIVAQSIGGGGGNAGTAIGAFALGSSGQAGGLGGTVTIGNSGDVTTWGDYSIGIVGQSIGGGGGNGSGSGGLFAIGGSGGTGQDAGTVNITNHGAVTTNGFFAYGIEAQSIGAGGGNGGGVIGLGALGASGSAAGNGGAASVTNTAPVSTIGNYSTGILAQSIGGGGGNGTLAVGLGAIGGSGASGGSGGTASVSNTGAITTEGTFANAIEAQSIGGGGGDGASSAGLFALGGSGSGTSIAGAVTVTNEGPLQTDNSNSAGILAQSIGGGGGNGGKTIGLFAFGGSGGSGADGGAVTVTNGGDITTGLFLGSSESPGILAQSIGGGGGNGGGAISAGPVAVAFGGGGGEAGNGSTVQVLRDSLSTPYTITTFGDASSAVIAQSIGGGGGNGGFAVAAAVVPVPFSVAIGAGGGGGGGGSAGSVEVDTAGTLQTFGVSSDGILAQSIGGGGGNGGFSVAASLGLGVSASVGVGGTGGTGGGASTVTVSSLSSIMTSGANSSDISAQSIGGGGGNGGFAVGASAGLFGVSVGVGGGGGDGGSAGDVNVTSVGNDVTTGANSTGISAQSIGGGGGNGGFSVAASIGSVGVSVTVGGSGATGGLAGNATINQTGSVLTERDNSIGMLAQSIGGGGGDGGFSAAGSIGIVGAVTVGLGGSGGPGQNAEGASVTANGGSFSYDVPGFGSGWTLVTEGANSSGIVAQSIGGGGGNGGFAGTGTLQLVAGASVSLGGKGAGGGNGGSATVMTTAENILTLGADSDGILAQSIGGGGGNGGIAGALTLAGNALPLAIGGSAAGGGAGGAVTLTSDGDITTVGDNSSAVFAQSVGGGGGNGGVAVSANVLAGTLAPSVAIGGSGGAGGAGGIVNVSSTGEIQTSGALAYGIFAQSVGGAGGNGGFAVAASLLGGGAVAVGVGGTGGLGQTSSAVTVGNIGDISTAGAGSDAIFAQSVGGGGGNGGFAGVGSLGGIGVSVGVGGSGGAGANGSTVNVTSAGNLTTAGSDAVGLFAQSIGGGGGNGGFSLGLALGGGAIGVNVGGTGAAGGDAGAVTVNSTGAITTGANGGTGANAEGLIAQSVGGGGGNGGFSGNVSIGVVAGIGVSVGGTGGGGGDAGAVSVTSAGDISTIFNNSTGVLAQSLGGGGGNGGFSLALSGSGAIEGIGASGAVSVGGHGGTAGDASSVTVSNTGTILTTGALSNGIEAQSLGGGGGNGGFSVAGTFTLGVVGVGVSVGGFGAGGGTSGDVTVDAYADPPLLDSPAYGVTTLETEGDQSNGILAQSIGGGGGNGGFSGALGASIEGAGAGVSVGGFAGSGGGVGGTVTVTSYNNILTLGDKSDGILAQSIGGGGGNGGFSIALGAGDAFGGAVSVGGFGGGGENSGAVIAQNFGTVMTEGADSNGIAAQSIGGGGGNGGFSIAGAFAVDAAALGVSVGGFGATAGNAGTVEVDSYWQATDGTPNASSPTYGVTTLETMGDRSNGILAQSLGGGGGNGGFSGAGALDLGGAGIAVSVGGFGAGGGSASSVTVNSANNIVTLGQESNGILAQSIGGGGGNGGFSIGLSAGSEFAGTLSVGGTALGGGGAPGAVAVTNYGTIMTEGSDSNGIEAQSIGGSGGNGGFSVSGAFTTGSAALGLSVGGFGSGGGNGNTVTVSDYSLATDGVPVLGAPAPGTTTLETEGDRSNGILAQSLGGGGGNGGFSATGALALGDGSVGVSVGGFGAGGGSGDAVTVNSGNNIVTLGQQSNGILAQSLGGGGGNGGFSIGLTGASEFAGTLSVGGSALDGGGPGGSVTVSSYGTILTEGNLSNGIEAQSIGGGGGNGGFSVSGAFTTGSAAIGLTVGGFGSTGSTGGAVTVDSYSLSSDGEPLLEPPAAGTISIETEGNQSNGILAQSIGGGGGNGGFSGGLSASTDGGAFTASVGGFGAGGGSAGAVNVTSYNNILTLGNDSNGIAAQSLGGGGGNGGFSIGLAGGDEFGGALSVGGFALTGGGNGGAVTLESFGTIETSGDRSNGLEAQSIGGSGGNGGFSLSGSLSLSNAGLSASVGGSASGGGSGGDVTLDSNEGGTLANSNATIETLGQSANGIEAQSIGGGGGNGGFSGGFTATADSKASITLSVGGFGAPGNHSGDVTVVTVDNILTEGAGSNGILAQSIGGGGGNGGFSFAGTVSVPDGNTFTLSASLGGFGGSAGNAGGVDVTSTGLISTLGDNANGTAAQSLGGGGGNGGLSVAGSFNFASEVNIPSITASVGGFGGSGGAGGDVNVTRTGVTTTVGDSSVGVLAQSIGGGGGNGGLSVAGSIGGPDAKQISASVGGFGGPGSEAGDVTVDNTGAITTGSITMQDMEFVPTVLPNLPTVMLVPVVTGNSSDGILAQSIGGGGGNGGFAFSGAIGPTGENMSIQVGLTLGGFGGSGGTAGDVSVTNVGEITTFGAQANGIEAQSLGGGGGNGGGALTGILSAGNPASGGNAVAFAASVGGFGGSGNVAGNVYVDQTGGIVTYGPGSNGILAQSIGGGGGVGGGANTESLQLGTSCTFGLVSKIISACQSPKKASVNIQVDVGGFGGTGNNAGTVTVINNSFITTGAGSALGVGAGDSSAGIMAQSIGGGGGNGGQAIVGLTGLFPGATYVDDATTVIALAISNTGLAQGLGRITVGGFGGASGNGSTVDVTNYGVIQTNGVSSYGIFAQSVGGGGGVGGNASSGLTGLASLGGFGGASGNGGDVNVTNEAGANIVTVGTDASAIVAQSIGGGGGEADVSGNNGSASATPDSPSEDTNNGRTVTYPFEATNDGTVAGNGGSASGLISVGGFGGASGNGGAVTVTNDALLQTSGDHADGILAQSIGGGGGDGGGTGLSIIAVGGFANALGATGNGGDVTVTNSAARRGSDSWTIATMGVGSDGIEAQSIGGSGGNGGGNSLAAGVTVGGWGANAGTGGQVQVFNNGSILTEGDNAIGISAQSIGGSGGTGGGSVLSLIAVGGAGGSGGNGGETDVTNTATIQTLGAGADAILAQSIGAGGGAAGGVGSVTEGALGISVTVGGALGAGSAPGGGAGSGGLVNVQNSGALLTEGDQANGIEAQSIGGGGGDGGRAVGLIAVGGAGGVSGDGGTVEVTNAVTGQITTLGVMSNGILAQSIGGGGGNAGGVGTTGTTIGFATTVGGSAGAVGSGGEVTVDNAAEIATYGAASQAIAAQSIGGGGGNAGVGGSFNAASNGRTITVGIGGSSSGGGNGGAVNVTNSATGAIYTYGLDSTAIFAQSVGGGGGSGGGALTAITALTGSTEVSLGGNGGPGGLGGAVTVTNGAPIMMDNDNSVGILAQSVGGGGGTAGTSLGQSVSVLIGGQGGVVGNGGDVAVTNTGSIAIVGNDSIGIFAQSVGGGGGFAKPGGNVTSVTTESGGTGNGGAVTVNNSASSIIVTGDNSMALFAQSVGGGGGAVGLTSDPPGQVGALLFAGTAGGAGTAGAVVVNQTGNLIATGLNSIALTAQSNAAGGNGNIAVNITNPAGATSVIIGGFGSGAGVEFLDGANNTLNTAGVISALPTIPAAQLLGGAISFSPNDGTITVTPPAGGGAPKTYSGVNGYAILGGAANEAVVNTGVIMGSVNLGAGVNSIDNKPGAFFDVGSVVNVGVGNLVTNEGLLSPGGYQNVFTTNITGNLLQTATGSYGVDLNLDPSTDLVLVSGTATMSGHVVVNLINPLTAPGLATPGTHEELILRAAGGETHPGLTLTAPSTAVSSYSLVYPNATDIDLQYTINFSPISPIGGGLTQNETSVGNAINTIQTLQNSPAFRAIATNLFYLPNVATLAAAYDSLSGEGVSAAQQTAFTATDYFLSTINNQVQRWTGETCGDDSTSKTVYENPPGSLPTHKGEVAPACAYTRTWRIWGTGFGGGSHWPGDAVIGSAEADQHTWGFAGGLDYQITPYALLGVSAGGGVSSFGVGDRATSGTVDAFHGALYGALRNQGFYASGIVAYDQFNDSESRTAVIPGVVLPAASFIDGPFSIPGFYERPTGSFGAHSWSGYGEVGYDWRFGGMFTATPFVGLEYSSLKTGAFTESNQGLPSAIGLSFASTTTTSVPGYLGLQLDAKGDLPNLLTPFDVWVRGAWQHEFSTSRSFDASFISAPGVDFTIQGAQPPHDALATTVGLKLNLTKNAAIFGTFEGQFGANATSVGGTGGVVFTW
jgi:hypothetical protein